MSKQNEVQRVFQPTVIQTKEDFLTLLKSGHFKTSKYNILSQEEKLFVEMVVFGDYTSTQAIKAIDPTVRNPTLMGNRMLANPDVASTIEELSMQKDKKFMAEIMSARDLALSKLKYIMSTTKDEALAAAAAKTILDTSGKVLQANAKKEDEPVGQVRFSIQVENMYTGANPQVNPVNEPVVIPIDDTSVDHHRKVVQQEIEQIDEELDSRRKKLKEARIQDGSAPLNPETGLPYTFKYESVNLYEENEDD